VRFSVLNTHFFHPFIDPSRSAEPNTINLTKHGWSFQPGILSGLLSSCSQSCSMLSKLPVTMSFGEFIRLREWTPIFLRIRSELVRNSLGLFHTKVGKENSRRTLSQLVFSIINPAERLIRMMRSIGLQVRRVAQPFRSGSPPARYFWYSPFRRTS
jgi:hypothetical protein